MRQSSGLSHRLRRRPPAKGGCSQQGGIRRILHNCRTGPLVIKRRPPAKGGRSRQGGIRRILNSCRTDVHKVDCPSGEGRSPPAAPYLRERSGDRPPSLHTIPRSPFTFLPPSEIRGNRRTSKSHHPSRLQPIHQRIRRTPSLLTFPASENRGVRRTSNPTTTLLTESLGIALQSRRSPSPPSNPTPRRSHTHTRPPPILPLPNQSRSRVSSFLWLRRPFAKTACQIGLRKRPLSYPAGPSGPPRTHPRPPHLS